MKKILSNLFTMTLLLAAAMNSSAQIEYVQNGGFEENDPFGTLGASFYFNEVENWSSNSIANAISSEFLCSGTQTTFPEEGEYFATVYKNSYLRNTLSKSIHPGQKLDVSLLHKKVNCNAPSQLSFDINLHSQGAQSGFPSWSNPQLKTNIQSVGGGWQELNFTKDVPIPFLPNGVDFCSYPEVDLFFPNSFVPFAHHSIMGFDAFSITGCEQESEAIIYTNMENETNCARVNFTTECDLENTKWYHWEFGDGTKASGATLHNPTHTYPDKGEYSVTLTRVNANGCLEITTSLINVECGDCKGVRIRFNIPEKSCKVKYGWVQDPMTLQWYEQAVANRCELTFNGLAPNVPFVYIVSWNWTANGVPFSNLQNPTALFTTSSPLPEEWEFCLNVVNSDGCVAQACQTVTLPCFFQNSVSNESIIDYQTSDLNSTNTNFSIFPNPVIDQLTVVADLEGDLKDWEINIHDISGQLILKESGINLSTNFRRDVDVSDLNTGTYLVNFITAEQVISEKIIIQRN